MRRPSTVFVRGRSTRLLQQYLLPGTVLLLLASSSSLVQLFFYSTSGDIDATSYFVLQLMTLVFHDTRFNYYYYENDRYSFRIFSQLIRSFLLAHHR